MERFIIVINNDELGRARAKIQEYIFYRIAPNICHYSDIFEENCDSDHNDDI